MTLSGPCHRGRNALEIDGELPEKLTRCACSLCAKRGHLFARYSPGQMKVSRAGSDAFYRWNSKADGNHFCSACGCDLYADSSDFQGYGSWDGRTCRIAINTLLLDDFRATDRPTTVLDRKHLW